MPNGNIFYFATYLKIAISYGVSVERNRQNSETDHAVEYVRNRRTLYPFF